MTIAKICPKRKTTNRCNRNISFEFAHYFDKYAVSCLSQVQDQLEEFLPVVVLPILLISAKNKTGLEAIQREIANIIQLSPADVAKDSKDGTKPALLAGGTKPALSSASAGPKKLGGKSGKTPLGGANTKAKLLAGSVTSKRKGGTVTATGKKVAGAKAKATGKATKGNQQQTPPKSKTLERKLRRDRIFGKVKPTRKQRKEATKRKSSFSYLTEQDLYAEES